MILKGSKKAERTDLRKKPLVRLAPKPSGQQQAVEKNMSKAAGTEKKFARKNEKNERKLAQKVSLNCVDYHLPSSLNEAVHRATLEAEGYIRSLITPSGSIQDLSNNKPGFGARRQSKNLLSVSVPNRKKKF